MWKRHSYLVFLVWFNLVSGQEKEISGVIKTVQNEPIPFANIVVNDSAYSSQPITYGYSNEEGLFSFQVPHEARDLQINVTALGFIEKTIYIDPDIEPSLDIYLEESTTELKEVVVEARKIKDTFNIDSYPMNLSKESTLGDILNKTEGVIIGQEGGISYHGKQINKVLINGKEVFVNQNKVALENLNYEIMENVQIISNYQDRFTVDFRRVRDPVINIETKKEFKGILKTELEAGYGYKNKYGFNGNGFFFSEKLNAFLTTHTNNTGRKKLSQKDITASVTRNMTASLSNILYPFFIEDYQAKRNFSSNTSLTLRRQGSNSKTGVIVYHGGLKTERNSRNTTFIADTLVKTSDRTNSEHGSFISITANHSHIVSPRTILQNVSSIIAIQLRQNMETADTIFVPEKFSFLEGTREAPKNVTYSNDLKVTQLLNDDQALELGLEYYHENNDRDLISSIETEDVDRIFQREEINKNYISGYGNFKLRLNKAALNAGIAVTKSTEKGNILMQDSSDTSMEVKRNLFIGQIPLSLNGSIKKLDYTSSFTPTLIHTKSNDTRSFLQMNHQVIYNFEAQNTLQIQYEHEYNFYNLNSLFDTIAHTYNHKIISDSENIDRYSQTDEVSLSWFNSNVARSKNIHFVYRFKRENDFLQTVLDSISDNTFFYSNRVFDTKRNHMIDFGAKKGYYFSSAYHRFDIEARLTFESTGYMTLFNQRSAEATSNSWHPALEAGFTPRNWFFKELSNQIKWQQLSFGIDGEKITKQSVVTNILRIRGHDDRINWNADFSYKFYNINQNSFTVPDLSLSFKYSISDNLSFSLVGRSLLTLFNLNNYRFINTVSDGNILTRITTNRNLGYLMFYTTFDL